MTPATTARGARPQPRPSRVGGPDGPPGWSPLKALVVVVVAVALGVYLVDLGGGHHAPASAATSGTTPSTTPKGHTPTTPPTTAPPTTSTTTTAPSGLQPNRTVKVLVANASQTNGVAGYYSSKLAGLGWGTLTPMTASTAESTSSVYYATGMQQDALAVAASIGVASSGVRPLGGVVPVLGSTNADVVVVAGNDLAAKMPAGSG